MRSIGTLLRAVVVSAALCAPLTALAQDEVRIGQATSALSFLPIWGARALDSFAAENLTPTIAVIPGGDPSSLAALDAGDIDFAAVGSESVIRAVQAGQPYEIVYSLMSKVTLQLVVSDGFLERTGVTADSPLEERLAALKGALFGVSSIGGAQDIAAQWLAKQGGLDPKSDIEVAKIGSPPAVLAAMENDQIDALVLSPPIGYLAEQSGAGAVLVSMGDDFPFLADLPFLVLVAKTPMDDATKDLLARTVTTLQAASTELVDNTDEAAAKVQAAFFEKADPASIAAAIESMASGIASGGALSAEGFENLLRFAAEVGTDLGGEVDAAGTEGTLWTNEFVDAAKAN